MDRGRRPGVPPRRRRGVGGRGPRLLADLGTRPGRREGGVRARSSTSSSERLERRPGMHVYHYAGYEAGAIKRLMQRHGDARRRGRPAAPRRRPRRPLQRRPPGHPRVGRVVLDQEDREVLPARPRGAGHRGRLLGGRLRDLAARRRRPAPARPRRLQPRRLRLDLDAPRLARGAAARGDRRAAGRWTGRRSRTGCRASSPTARTNAKSRSQSPLSR